MTEVLRWHDASAQLPDSDITVRMWVEQDDGEREWLSGWLDGNVWRDCSSALPVVGSVRYWAEPSGPEGSR